MTSEEALTIAASIDEGKKYEIAMALLDVWYKGYVDGLESTINIVNQTNS